MKTRQTTLIQPKSKKVDYIEKAKKVKCPICNRKQVSFLFKVDSTIIYCQNSRCDSIGRIEFISYHHSNPKFPEIISRFNVVCSKARKDDEYKELPKKADKRNEGKIFCKSFQAYADKDKCLKCDRFSIQVTKKTST